MDTQETHDTQTIFRSANWLVGLIRAKDATDMGARCWAGAVTFGYVGDVLVISVRISIACYATNDARAHAWMLLENSEDSFWATRDRVILCYTPVSGLITHIIRGADTERTQALDSALSCVAFLYGCGSITPEELTSDLVSICTRHCLPAINDYVPVLAS